MPRESREAKRKRVQKCIRLFQKYYPDAECALDHENPYQLLMATILSAQCTDERVNKVTPELFKKFPSVEDLAEADQKNVEDIIKSTGFYRNKAKNMIKAAQDIVDKHDGDLPQNLDDMVDLAGVGRKTANVVLGNAFDIASGVVVDTHVRRLSNRLGWSQHQNPEKIEKDLIELVPKKHWVMISHWLITHGRKTCKARKPRCEVCFLADHCPQIGVN